MGGYVALPPALTDDPSSAAPLVDKALTHVAALPPKQPKKKKAK